ncbi:hypothetical protein [Paenibacillus apiarius]|uniref:hypothetical protein n=1 Tax=Paenibacillus apiarius TaxID=46240 RepID=UPI00197E1450|nr:hypothetical protein [Paenibacillus apiarius]MBN3522732.1 hypothetical protein [Paenibacillus apiarius]
MNELKKTVFALLLILLIVGCTHNTSQEEEDRKNLLPFVGDSQGYALGLYNNGEIEANRTFEISEDGFIRNVVFRNFTKKDEKFILLIFDNGRQMDFELEDKKMNSYPFLLKKGVSADLSIKLEGLEDGFHSINYVILRDPDLVITTTTKIKKAEQLSQIFGMRINILKNIDAIPEKTTEIFDDYSVMESSKLHGSFLSKPDKDYTMWLSDIPDQNNSMNFNLLYGNKEDSVTDFYLILLDNWEQVPIRGQDVVYDNVKNKMDKKISVKLTDVKGKHILQSLILPNPYTALTKESRYTSSPVASLRTLIQ